MNWERFRQDLQSFTEKVTEKAGDLLKEGADAIKTGAGKAAAKTSYAAQLASLNWEQQALAKKMQSEFTSLGNKVYALLKEDRLRDVLTETEAQLETLAKLETQIAEVEEKKEKLSQELGFDAKEKDALATLTRDLQAGGGTMRQIVVDADAPLAGKKLKSIRLPKEALIATVVRGEAVIIPDGQTTLEVGDKITLIGKEDDVLQAASMLSTTPAAEAETVVEKEQSQNNE